jgi:hypothetical protein
MQLELLRPAVARGYGLRVVHGVRPAPGVDDHLIPQACVHVIPQVLAYCLFYLMSSFGVGVMRPGLLFGR